MLAADADLQVVARGAAELHRELHELADTVLVEHLEGIILQNPVLDIEWQEPSRVIARQAEGRLREVVRPKRKELGFLRDLVGREGGPRQLDHGAHEIRDRPTLRLEYLLRHAADDLRLPAQLLRERDQRDHHFDHRLLAAGDHSTRRLEDRPGLHLGDLGIGDAEPAAAMTQHRVGLDK